MRKNWKTAVTTMFLMFLVMLNIPLMVRAEEVSGDTTFSWKAEFDYETFEVFLTGVIICIMLVCIINLLRSSMEYKSRYKLLKKAYEDNLQSLQAARRELSESYGREETLRHWKLNALEVLPTLEEEINDLLARKEAKEFQRIYVDEMHAQYVMNVVAAYNNLSDGAKEYIPFDPEKSFVNIQKEKDCKTD